MAVDVESLDDMFGGDFSSRARIVAYPACVLTTPEKAGCSNPTLVDAVRDDASRMLVADVEADPVDAYEPVKVPAGLGFGKFGIVLQSGGGQGGWIYGVSGGPSGAAGTYEASSLSSTGSWSVNGNTGGFSWGYDVPVPASPGGFTPKVAVQYSSQSVDAMTSSKAAQPGLIGLGWSLSTDAYIERKYWDCKEQGMFNTTVNPLDELNFPGSLCWHTDNAYIAMNGQSSELVRVDAGNDIWRLKDDPSWKVQRFTGLGNGDGAGASDAAGENWKVTTPDGTQYLFGATASSTLTVPVGFDTGSICDPNPAVACTAAWVNGRRQAWRWNLSHAFDVNGNMQGYSYEKEPYWYSVNSPTFVVGYDRAARLQNIAYGQNLATTSLSWHSGVITFSSVPRCSQAMGNDNPVNCPGFVANAAQPDGGTVTIHGTNPSSLTSYPDVPTDLMQSCDGLWCGTNTGPTFFTVWRTYGITTQTQDGGGGWLTVDFVRLASASLLQVPVAELPASVNVTVNRLWLRSIARLAYTSNSTSTAAPMVSFGGTYLNNMATVQLPRVTRVREELGAATQIEYGQPNPCLATDPQRTAPATFNWQTNTKDCFPAQDATLGATPGTIGAPYNRWLTTAVTVYDTAAGSPPLRTTYTYVGSPFHSFEFSNNYPPTQHFWDQWRGYGQVRVTKGFDGVTARADAEVTETKYYRGYNEIFTGQATFFNGAAAQTDHVWMAGKVIGERRLIGGTVAADTRRYYSETQAITGTYGLVARTIKETKTETDEPASTGTRTTRTEATFDPSTGVQLSSLSYGNIAITTDDRCIKNVYVQNTAAWIVDTVRETTGYDNIACTTLSSRTQYAYDGGAIGTAPTRGNLTLTRSYTGAASFIDSTRSYDLQNGRVTQIVDGRGTPVTYTYTTAWANGNVTQVVSAKAGLTAYSQFELRRGLVSLTIGNAGETKWLTYDGFGRLISVRDHGEPVGTNSIEYQYVIDTSAQPNDITTARAPAYVKSRVLQSLAGDVESPSSTIYVESWNYVDGLGRPRQSQTASPAGGRIVTNTTYNPVGQVYETFLPVADASAAGSGLKASLTSGPRRRVSYDPLGRPVLQETFGATGTSALWAAKNRYQADRTFEYTANGTHPTLAVSGGKLTTFDAYGKPVTIDALKTRPAEADVENSNWAALTAAAKARTQYSYLPSGEMATMTDPAGNVTSYAYDWLGRRTSFTDPDRGTTSYVYDNNSNITKTVDAANRNLFSCVDTLDRIVQESTADCTATPATTTASTLTFRTFNATNGRLTSAKTFSGGAVYEKVNVAFDGKSNPTIVDTIIPAAEGALAGTYRFEYRYDRAGHLVETKYPAAGNLPAETRNQIYSAFGQPDKLVTRTGTNPLPTVSWGTTYDALNRPATRTTEYASGGFSRSWSYNPDTQLVSELKSEVKPCGTGSCTPTPLHQQQLTLDPNGNITEKTEPGQERFCFGYDPRARMTSAWTTATSNTCMGTFAAPDPTGVAPFKGTYAYNDINNITSSVERTASASTGGTVTYAGPTPASGGGGGGGVTYSGIAPSGAGSGWWKLNDATGGTGADSSGQNHPLTLTGGAGWGLLGSGVPALSLGASANQLVKAPSVTLNSGGYTIAATIRVDASTLTSTNPVIVQSKTAAGVIAAQLSLSPPSGSANWAVQGTVRNSAGTSVYPWGGYVIPTGQDIRVAMTVSGTEAKLYVNGALVNTTPFTGPASSGTDVVVGSDWWGGTNSGSLFKGQIGDVRLFGSALTATDIAAINATTGGGGGGGGAGSGWWKLNDATGGTGADSSGQNHPLTLTGGASWGLLGSGVPSLSLSASANQLAKAPSVTLNSGGYTIAATIRVDASTSTTTNPVIVQSKTAAGVIAAQLSLSPPSGSANWAVQGTVRNSAGTSVYPWGGYVIPTGQDIRVAMTVSATEAKLYVNGSLVNTTPFTGPASSGTDVIVGSDWWGGTNSGSLFKGQIGDVRLFGSALTATDIAAINASVSGGGGSTFVTKSDTYTYGTAGKPHAPSAIGAGTYTWTAYGAMQQRVVNGRTDTFSWNVLGQLITTASTGTVTGTSTYVYDATGQRLLRRDPTSTVLYLDGTEVELKSGQLSGTRYHTLGNDTIGYQKTGTNAGTYYVGLDDQNTMVVSGTSATDQTRQRYTPWGAPRGTANVLKGTERGFLNKTEDDQTNLTYLSARYYDPVAKLFTTVDPLHGPFSVFNSNPFSYAAWNPGTLTDASGAWPWSKALDVIHTGLDVLGMVPVFGEPADGLNALIYAGQGDFVNAGISGAALWPAGGQAATGARLAVKGAKAVAKEVGEEAGEKVAKKVAKEAEKELAEKVVTSDALAARATAVHGVLDPIAQRSRTTAALSTREGPTILASGGRDLSPAQRALAKSDEVLGKLPKAHAEVTALDTASKVGLTPSKIAVSRPICAECKKVIVQSGGKIDSNGKSAKW